MNKVHFFEKLKGIKAFFLDIDGVLTNGNLLITENGELLRTMHVKDGYALKKAVDEGYFVAVISGGKSEGVRIRLQRLGIEEVHLGVQDKVAVFEELCRQYGLQRHETVFMGDDFPDYEVLQKAEAATCPCDAAPAIMELCDYISPYKGGEGCVRDLIESTLRLQGKWNEPLASNE
ncbi:MAG: HAD hydrolase family protein [Sphingobacteriales bacterium]|nr:HAD hydrolase family protein [Sphingobacteriales bacterium]